MSSQPPTKTPGGSAPITQTTTSAESDGASNSSSDVKLSVDDNKTRRTSVLFTESDRMGQPNQSMDEVISRTAKTTASFTDDNILRKNSDAKPPPATAKPTKMSKKAKKAAKRSSMAQTVEPVAPNQFENSIKDNKLDFGDQASSKADRSNTILSPTAKVADSNVADPEILPGVNLAPISIASPDKEDNDDPLTLVGDKRASELQEYIPEDKTEDEETKDYEPTQVELAPAAQAEESLHHHDEEQLPWETNATESKLPWDETTNDAEAQSDALPWDEESNDAETQSDALPWDEESNDAEKQSDALPWDEETKNVEAQSDALPWESDSKDGFDLPTEKSNKHTPENNNEEVHAEEFGSKHDETEQTQHASQEANDLPWLAPETHTKKSQQEGASEVVQSDNAEHASAVPEEVKTSQPQVEKTSDDSDELFPVDDREFLRGTETESSNFKFPGESSDSKEANGLELNSSFEDKSESLDFLEMDDELLLDDEFLEDDTAAKQNTSVSSPASHGHTSKTNAYVPAPSAHVAAAITAPTTHDQHKNLNKTKKKNDAYDFPENLLAQKFKPAARTSNKYTRSNAPTPKAPPKPGFSASSPAAPAQDIHKTQIPSSGDASQAPQTSRGSNKSFFEDLPVPMLKQGVKPARAALPKAQGFQNISPNINQNHPPIQQPIVNPYAKPVVNTSQMPTPNSAGPPPGMPPVSNNHTSAYSPQNMAPPTQLASNNFSQMQQFPSTANPNGLPATANPNTHGRRISSASPIPLNTSLPKSSQSATSPYVPNAGPYAPSSHKRTSSRASSLVGAKSKEINPYAPILPRPNNQQSVPQGVVPASNNLTSGALPPKATLSPSVPPASVNNVGYGRRRGVSNSRTNVYGKEHAQSAPFKIDNPNALLQRQFPIFNWSSSKNVTYLVPSLVTNSFTHTAETVKVTDISGILKDNQFLSSFPGPLNKSKSKKKDLEKWLESHIQFIGQDQTGMKQNELLLNQILLALVRNDGSFKSKEFTKDACSVLNPGVHYSTDNNQPMEFGNSINVVANAYRLDNAGMNIVWSLLQVGNTEQALEFCLSKGDWALSLMLASFSGSEKFGKIASDYARSTFPFQKSQSKVHHLMPLMLKLFTGNCKSAIEDIRNVQAEGEWAIQHWRELVSLVVINANQNSHEFLCEFGKILSVSDQDVAGEICFILAGLPLSSIPLQSNGVVFSFIGFDIPSFMYSEIYEYALQLGSSAIPPTGFPHLLPIKLKHAQVLADYGLFTESQKYCDAISGIIKATGRSSFFNPIAFHEFQNLLMRISDSGSSESGWFGSRISKVNLDKMWGHLDKIIGGEDPKAKSNENGVFSNFSPSVSRVPSSLDITAMPNNYSQTSPQARPDFNRDSLVATNSAPATSAENSVLKLNNISHSKAMQGPPSLYSNNSTSSIHKYAPPSTQGFSKPSGPRSEQSATSPQQFNNPVLESLQQSRAGPQSTSSQYLPLNPNENLAPPAKPQSRYSPGTQKTKNPSFPYSNPSAHASNSSLASHQSLPIGVSQQIPNANQTFLKDTPLSNTLSNQNIADVNEVRSHKHSTSLQSDISLDYPSEFKTSPKKVQDGNDSSGKQNTEEETETNPKSLLKPTADTNEVADDTENSKSGDENGKVPSTEGSAMETLTETAIAHPPPPPMAGPTNSNSTAPKGSLPKKGRARANPYAPGASTAKSSAAKSRYGPPASTKYTAPKKEGDSQLVDDTASSSYNDIFNYGGYQVPDKAPTQKHEEVKGDNEEEKTNKPDTQIEAMDGASNSNYKRQNKSEKSPTATTTNVDDSFDNENINDADMETSSIRTPAPQPRYANVLNNSSFRSGEKDSMFHPYQGDTRERRISNFGVDNSFGDFPIPCSPDLTTRANSVVGGPGGLFSSRLSQSQQSALYQQYEVQDDTVTDYIPIVDEEEEDSEDESDKKERKKKEEKERRERIESEKQRQRRDAAAAAAGNQNGLWGLFGRKKDDKPKPIRAKLGEKNAFQWDEKHGKWINKDLPLEEQLKPAAAPPPPAAKKRPTESTPSSTDNSTPSLPKPNGIPKPGAPKSSAPRPPSGSSAPPGPSLANAGLEDLLSLGGPSTGGTARKSKKGTRRGYVNLLDQK